MESMSSNKVWTLVDPPKGFKPIGCKWVYKRNLGADVEVITFKARLVAKGYTQRPDIDVKTTFLNGFIEEEIYMDQPNEFDPCIYKKVSVSSIVFLVLYMGDNLLIGNDVKEVRRHKSMAFYAILDEVYERL
ncbi:Retrovirus-related Pol polyprotein from transposon RE1 [Sesamum angolense]|uniref:Retrovirus-related Pol polyprotein from transposon RE1 n=1 Tax=Sesamum angolense TaxID=2727404 RepID=A0AAE1T9H2_9LAMI|nr:Retrovirus-related Pol polyprotein from transposon RE1 [Sesamum angolense]